MLDGLRREFPEVVAALGRLPAPRVARASLLWAILAAYGAALFVGAGLSVLLTLAFRLLGIGFPEAFAIVTAIGTGSALAIAWTVGGREAVIAYGAILIAEQALALPGLVRFCLAVPSGQACSPLAYVIGLWPYVLGGVLANALVRWMRAGPGDRNPLLEAAGALGLTQSLVSRFLSAIFIVSSGFEASLLVIVGAVAGGIACGLTLLRRVTIERRWATLAFVALAVIGEWVVVSTPQFAEQVGFAGRISIGGMELVGFASPLIQIGVAAVVLYMATARRMAAEA